MLCLQLSVTRWTRLSAVSTFVVFAAERNALDPALSRQYAGSAALGHSYLDQSMPASSARMHAGNVSISSVMAQFNEVEYQPMFSNVVIDMVCRHNQAFTLKGLHAEVVTH